MTASPTVVPSVRPAPSNAESAREEEEQTVASPMQLLARAGAAGDTHATHQLLTALAPRIASVVRAVFRRSHADVQDVQQQAMIAFVAALPSFRGECEPSQFASRIAARLALAALRRTRAAASRHDDDFDVNRLASDEWPHDDAVRRRRTDMLRDLLARLPAGQAETLTLRVVLGWSLAEVSSATGAPMNTVRSRVRLAKEALRSAIERDPRIAEELGWHGEASATG